MKPILFTLFFVSLISFASAQDVEMAAGLRSSGKIYIVIAVIAVIFTGLAIYLFSIDRRLKKLEETVNLLPVTGVIGQHGVLPVTDQ